MKANRQQLADILGRSLVTVDDYVKTGMPGVKRDRVWEFDTAECIAWLVAREAGIQLGPDKELKIQTLREVTARASLREYELSEKQKEVIRVEDSIIVLEEQLAIVKSRLQAIPGRLAQPLSVESDPATIQRMLKDEVAEALEDISTAETPTEPAL
jgi:phage terminase Nu1 subunit (DNA packaging protein)